MRFPILWRRLCHFMEVPKRTIITTRPSTAIFRHASPSWIFYSTRTKILRKWCNHVNYNKGCLFIGSCAALYELPQCISKHLWQSIDVPQNDVIRKREVVNVSAEAGFSSSVGHILMMSVLRESVLEYLKWMIPYFWDCQ